MFDFDIYDFEEDVPPEYVDWFHVYHEDGRAFIGWIYLNRDWNDITNINLDSLVNDYNDNHRQLIQKYEEAVKAICNDSIEIPVPDMHMICYMW